MTELLPGFNEVKINIRTKQPIPISVIKEGLEEMFSYEKDHIVVFEPQVKNVRAYNPDGEFLPLNPIYEKFEVLKSMNTIITHMNDENAYLKWIEIIPDGVDDYELLDIAEHDDDTYTDAVLLFGILMANKSLANGGLYVGSRVYKLRKD